jgi:GT2 family glycosyltransferase
VVTPVHNGIEHTVKFLASLKRQEYQNLVAVIVNDGSTDGTAERIAAEFPDVVVLPGDGNLWWSGATNEGVAHALKNGADYIFTVNNDVEVDPGAIAALVKTAGSRENKTLVGSVIYDQSERTKVWYAGGTFDPQLGELVHVREAGDAELPEPDWLTGMGVLIPAGVFDKTGLYDRRRFPQYFGDADFSLRAKKNRV